MAEFTLFALCIALGATLLIAVPVMTHPSLPRRAKWLLSLLVFILLMPIGFCLYAWLGVPQMAVL